LQDKKQMAKITSGRYILICFVNNKYGYVRKQFFFKRNAVVVLFLKIFLDNF